eukprot:7093458-Prymnesium_polylepis.2
MPCRSDLRITALRADLRTAHNGVAARQCRADLHTAHLGVGCHVHDRVDLQGLVEAWLVAMAASTCEVGLIEAL